MYLPAFIAEYSGDVLYASMFYILFGFCFPKWPIWKVALFTLISCYSIEFLQLYKPHWLQIIRHNRLGGLILGFDFVWSDLICYTVGAILGIIAEWFGIFVRQNNYFRSIN